MKLSDAIRRGAEKTTQNRFTYFNADASSVSSASTACALGAAVIGAGLTDMYYPLQRLMVKFPVLAKRGITCPACRGTDAILSDVIVCLNDHYVWTREQIADWLDTLNLEES